MMLMHGTNARSRELGTGPGAALDLVNMKLRVIQFSYFMPSRFRPALYNGARMLSGDARMCEGCPHAMSRFAGSGARRYGR